MTIKVVFRNAIETALIVSEVFTNMARNDELRDDWMDIESEGDTYAELTAIAEDIEDSMNEPERDDCGYEVLREMARERILERYGKPKEVYTIEYLPDSDISLLFLDIKDDNGEIKQIELLGWLMGKRTDKKDFDGVLRKYKWSYSEDAYF